MLRNHFSIIQQLLTIIIIVISSFLLKQQVSAACTGTMTCTRACYEDCTCDLVLGVCPVACRQTVCPTVTIQCSSIQESDGSCGALPVPQTYNCATSWSANCSTYYGTPGVTPSPVASGAPPPAEWGACGSCSGCGLTSNLCRTNPEGQCVADQGGCYQDANACTWAITYDSGGEQCKEAGQQRLESNDICCPDLVFRVDLNGICACPECGDGQCYGGGGENAVTCPADCCTASCTGAQCGQPNNCGGYCPSTDSGAPGTPVLTPANGGTVTISGTTATVQWTAVAKADSYLIDLYPSDSDCTTYPTHCGRSAIGTSYTFTPDYGKNSYTYRVSALNSSCGYQTGTAAGPATFTIMAPITGTFYNDPGQAAALAGSICALGGATPLDLQAATGEGISAVGSTGGTYNGTITTSTFNLLAPYWPTSWGANNIVTLNPGADGSGVNYTCTCPEGCTYSGVASPQAAVNYFLLPENLLTASWWQVQGGSAYAGRTAGISVYSPTPDTSTCSGASCSPYVSAFDATDEPLSAGLVVTGGGAIDSQRETGNQQTFVTEQSPQLFVTGTSTSRFQEKYEYFYRKFSFQNLNQAAVTPATLPAGQAYFYSGTLTLTEQWNIAAGENVIIFVDGDLIIADNSNVNTLITVEDGGFFALIVSGDITIHENVGNDTFADTTPNLEGVYIADGTITTASRGSAAGGDDRFVGAGSFIGWTGVNLERDFSSDADTSRLLNSQTTPSELFIYRPDFVKNIPEAMMSPRYIWQETN